ncbi:YHS domain-containing (seleno)protein [Octadecabacter sp. R77987]|uniref:YHS domain-containing (seleno)protein n=1 Tax=Octadecabacter sp. R77987 TaxID=3093874 RepID=UPI0036735357
MLTRRSLLAFAALTPAAALLAPTAMAATPETFAEGGLAIRGTDPVAYFDGNGPVAGSPDHQLMWKGATWQFASAANRAAFEANPMAYAPQYGGYCAFAMSRGYIASTDPEAWTLHDGKLYLNYSVSVRSRWLPDIAENIALADANWPAALDA